MMNTNKGITIDNVMDCLNCTRSYVYKLVRRNELEMIENSYPIRIEVDSIITKIRRLYPWIVNSCISSLHYNLKQLELKYS